MRTYSFTLVGARLALLLTITRVDGTVIRVTNYRKPITIGGHTWTPEPGLQIGDYTEYNNGDVPNLSFSVATGGLFTEADIKNGLFELADALLEITDAKNPVTKDYEASGKMKGDVAYDPSGAATFEVLNEFGLSRDIFVHQYTVEDYAELGDERWSKVPTFPTENPFTRYLADVDREEVLALGELRRFRYDANSNPSDYHNVNWEVTTAGTAGAFDPDVPSAAADVGRLEVLTIGALRRFQYAVGDYRGVVWEVTTGGTTGASDPVSPSDTIADTITDGTVVFTVHDAYEVGSTVTDGTVVFTVRNAYARAFQVTAIGDGSHIEIDVTEPRAASDTTWFAPSLLVMRSGAMKNRASDIDAWDGISQIEMVVPFADLLEVGDWGEIAPDYDQTLDMAVTKYNNSNNYRGFPHLTGTRLATSTFIPGVIIEFPTDDPGGGGGGGGGGSDGYESFAVEFLDGAT